MLLGLMQAQGHMQITIGLFSDGLDSQTAVAMPRFCTISGTHNSVVSIEEGVHNDVIEELEVMGHWACDGTP